MQIEIRDSLGEIAATHWNALNDDGNPFLKYEFLYGLEATGCLGQSTGWYPRYVLLWTGPEGERELLGGAPAYIKTNSYGEFVFDWAWADAYQNHNLAYYPKLVSCIPFNPATGRRLLVRHDQPYEETVKLLAGALRQYCLKEEYSGVHFLFVTEAESRILSVDAPEPVDAKQQEKDKPQATKPQLNDQQRRAFASATDHLQRLDCQFHWHNKGYRCFDDFLSQCTAKRRKTIRRERRHVSDKGLRLERRLGGTLSDTEWGWVHDFYASTFDRKWGNPSLTKAFFKCMGETFGDYVLIVFAYDDADETPEWPVACSIMFIGTHTLYGRFWGCRHTFHSLHFEACYYQGIEHCIENGIQNFEPGAQGEHKITRGFEPTLTYSAHYIAHPGFRNAIAGFLTEERLYVEQRCQGLNVLLPFKSAELTIDCPPI
ncbi:MAG: GNAT family N-acetyltransferase [Granulosicoccus sp.]